MADLRPSGLPPCLCLVCYLSPEQPLALREKWVSNGVEAAGVAEEAIKQEWGQHPAAGSKTNAGSTSWRANTGLMASDPTSH